MGVAIGIGAGYLNATMLNLPGWANILMMSFVASIALLAGEE
jgi:hypothetical protein